MGRMGISGYFAPLTRVFTVCPWAAPGRMAQSCGFHAKACSSAREQTGAMAGNPGKAIRRRRDKPVSPAGARATRSPIVPPKVCAVRSPRRRGSGRGARVCQLVIRDPPPPQRGTSASCGPGPRRSDDAGEAGQDADALALAHPALKARLNQQRQRIAEIVEHYRQSNAAGPQAQPDRNERRQRGKRHRHGIEREVPLGITEGVRHSEQHTR